MNSHNFISVIVNNFFRISCTIVLQFGFVQHVNLYFSRGPFQGTPEIPVQVLYWIFWGSPKQTPSIRVCQIAYCIGYVPTGGLRIPALEFWRSPKTDHQNSSKGLQTSQMRSPPPFFHLFSNALGYCIPSPTPFHLLCCASLIPID